MPDEPSLQWMYRMRPCLSAIARMTALRRPTGWGRCAVAALAEELKGCVVAACIADIVVIDDAARDADPSCARTGVNARVARRAAMAQRG